MHKTVEKEEIRKFVACSKSKLVQTRANRVVEDS